MATRDAGLDHHFVAGFGPCHQVPNFAHHARYITPKNVRQRNFDSRQTVPHPHIEMIQRAGAHLDENFIGFDLRIRDFANLENFRPAVL